MRVGFPLAIACMVCALPVRADQKAWFPIGDTRIAYGTPETDDVTLAIQCGPPGRLMTETHYASTGGGFRGLTDADGGRIRVSYVARPGGMGTAPVVQEIEITGDVIAETSDGQLLGWRHKASLPISNTLTTLLDAGSNLLIVARERTFFVGAKGFRDLYAPLAQRCAAANPQPVAERMAERPTKQTAASAEPSGRPGHKPVFGPYAQGVWQSNRNGATGPGRCSAQAYFERITSGGIESCPSGISGKCIDMGGIGYAALGPDTYVHEVPGYRYTLKRTMGGEAVETIDAKIVDTQAAIRQWGSLAKAQAMSVDRVKGVVQYRCSDL